MVASRTKPNTAPRTYDVVDRNGRVVERVSAVNRKEAAKQVSKTSPFRIRLAA